MGEKSGDEQSSDDDDDDNDVYDIEASASTSTQDSHNRISDSYKQAAIAYWRGGKRSTFFHLNSPQSFWTLSAFYYSEKKKIHNSPEQI